MATAASGEAPERTVASIARSSACANSAFSGCSLTMVSASAANCSDASLSRCVSPPARADQVSAAEAMRLRTSTSKAGS